MTRHTQSKIIRLAVVECSLILWFSFADYTADVIRPFTSACKMWTSPSRTLSGNYTSLQTKSATRKLILLSDARITLPCEFERIFKGGGHEY